MASIVTNGSSFPGTTINYNANSVSVSVGDTLGIYTGIVNSIYLGAKTALVVGAQTNISLGPQSNFTYGNVMSATWGDSWLWNITNNTVYDVASRWAALTNDYYGGMEKGDFESRWVEEAQGYLIAISTLTTYVITVGISLVSIQYPPFKMTGKDSSGNATGVETDAWWSVLAGSLTVILLAIGQFWMVKYITTHKKWNAVGSLSFCGDGITSYVFSEPKKSGQNSQITYTSQDLIPSFAKGVSHLLNTTGTTGHAFSNVPPPKSGSGRDAATSAYASIIVRPRIGDKKTLRSNDFLDSASDERIPNITLTSSESLDQKNDTKSSYIRILPNEVYISSQKGELPMPNDGLIKAYYGGNPVTNPLHDSNSTSPDAVIQAHAVIQVKGTISITNKDTRIDRTDGKIIISAADKGKNASSLIMKSDEVAISCGTTPDSNIEMNVSGVTIGGGEYQLAYTPEKVTIGKVKFVVESGGVSVGGGALFVKS